MTLEYLMVLFWLFGSHFVCDYALQSEFMAKGKNPDGSPHFGVPWGWTMTAHCFTHGVGVALVLGNVWFGLAEIYSHFTVDYLKCKKRFGASVDQTLHLSFMVLWWFLNWLIGGAAARWIHGLYS